MNSLTKALDLLKAEVKKIDPRSTKFRDNKDLLKRIAEIDKSVEHFRNKILAVSQANPLLSQLILSDAKHLQEDFLTMTNNIKPSQTLVEYIDWEKVMADLASLEAKMSTE